MSSISTKCYSKKVEIDCIFKEGDEETLKYLKNYLAAQISLSLKNAMLQRGFTEAKLARKIGIKKSLLVKHLEGRCLTVRDLSNICFALNVRPEISIKERTQ